MAITDWPAAERPREKLLSHGAVALSDAELLALFLRVGVRGKSAVDLARDLLTHFGSLTALFAAPIEQLSHIHGMGSAKYAQLQAVLEMARRALGETLQSQPLLNSPTQVRDYLRLHLGQRKHEVFIALWLDVRHQLIACDEVAQGTLTHASIHPREVVKKALANNAAAVIFAHNHPSGSSTPSSADQALTQALRNALQLIDVSTLDHFIVSGNSEPLSMAERGLM